jgi:hypothetical protein
MITADKKKEQGYVMAEAIFAGKQVKEFSLQQASAGFGFFYTVLSWFTEYFLMCDRPGYTCDGNGKQEQIPYLVH